MDTRTIIAQAYESGRGYVSGRILVVVPNRNPRRGIHAAGPLTRESRTTLHLPLSPALTAELKLLALAQATHDHWRIVRARSNYIAMLRYEGERQEWERVRREAGERAARRAAEMRQAAQKEARENLERERERNRERERRNNGFFRAAGNVRRHVNRRRKMR